MPENTHVSRMVMRCNSNQWETIAPFSEICRNTFLFSLWCETNRPCSCYSVAQSCLTLCDPMHCSTPGLLVPHHLPEFAQVHVHCIGNAIRPSYPLTPLLLLPWSFPASETFPMSYLFWSDDQNQIRWASASASVLPVTDIQGWSPLRLIGLISLLSKELSGVLSSTTVWRHHFSGILPSLQSNCHNHTWPLGRP